MKNIEYIGLIAGFFTTIAFLPQIFKIFKSKSAKDISLVMYIIYVIGIILWFIYGCLIKSHSIIIANTVTLILVSITIFIKIKKD